MKRHVPRASISTTPSTCQQHSGRWATCPARPDPAVTQALAARVASGSTARVIRASERSNTMKMPDDVKSELFNVLTSLPKEVDGLKRAIVDGSFDGSTYDTSNGTRGACLVGTVCKMQMRRINRVFRADNGRDYTAKVTTPTGTFIVDADSALEQWVFFIYPENRGN